MAAAEVRIRLLVSYVFDELLFMELCVWFTTSLGVGFIFNPTRAVVCVWFTYNCCHWILPGWATVNVLKRQYCLGTIGMFKLSATSLFGKWSGVNALLMFNKQDLCGNEADLSIARILIHKTFKYHLLNINSAGISIRLACAKLVSARDARETCNARRRDNYWNIIKPQ